MLWIIKDPFIALKEYMGGGSNEDLLNKLNTEVATTNLGFANIAVPHPLQHPQDHQFTLIIYNQLVDILLWCTTSVEEHLDNIHQQHMQDVETKTLMQSIAVTKATAATAEILCKEKVKNRHVVDEVLDESVAKKVKNILTK